MKPLETNQRVLTWLCGVRPNESDKNGKNISHIILTLSIILVHLLAVISSVVFIYRNVSVNLEETLFSLLYNVGNSSALYQSVAIILLKDKLTEIFERLSKVYDKSKKKHFIDKVMRSHNIFFNLDKTSESFHLLKETNEKCESAWTIFFKYILGGFAISTAINATISVLYCYTTNGYFDVKHVYYPYRFM